MTLLATIKEEYRDQLFKMKVKLELFLTRTVTVNVVDKDLDDLATRVQQLQNPKQEVIPMKVIEINGRNVGTSLDVTSALEVSKDQNIVKFRQRVPGLLRGLRKSLNSKFQAPKPHQNAMTEILATENNTDQSQSDVDIRASQCPIISLTRLNRTTRALLTTLRALLMTKHGKTWIPHDMLGTVCLEEDIKGCKMDRHTRKKGVHLQPITIWEHGNMG